MTRHSTDHCLGMIARLVLVIVMMDGAMVQPVLAQAKKGSDKRGLGL